MSTTELTNSTKLAKWCLATKSDHHHHLRNIWFVCEMNVKYVKNVKFSFSCRHNWSAVVHHIAPNFSWLASKPDDDDDYHHHIIYTQCMIFLDRTGHHKKLLIFKKADMTGQWISTTKLSDHPPLVSKAIIIIINMIAVPSWSQMITHSIVSLMVIWERFYDLNMRIYHRKLTYSVWRHFCSTHKVNYLK